MGDYRSLSALTVLSMNRAILIAVATDSLISSFEIGPEA
jgi:hypothetical protein